MATRVIPPSQFDLNIEPGSVKAAATDQGAKRSDMWMVPVSALTILPDFNIRITGTAEYEAGIEALAESILHNGFYRDKPFGGKIVKLDDGSSGYGITDGHRRHAALLLAIEKGAQIEEVPFVAVNAAASPEDLTLAMMMDSEPKTPYELAIGVSRLIKWGMDEGQIAKRLGKTKTYINDLVTLLSMPAKIRNLVMNGKVSATLAIKEFRADAKTAGERLTGAVETAEKSGKKRATAKHVEAPEPNVKPGTATTGAAAEGEPAASTRGRKPNPLRTEFEFAANAGDTVALSALAPFQRFGGGAWWLASDETPGMAVILQDVKIKGVCVLKEKPIGEVVGAVVPGTEDL